MTYFAYSTGISERIRVVRRGCVDVHENIATGCYDALDYKDEVNLKLNNILQQLN